MIAHRFGDLLFTAVNVYDRKGSITEEIISNYILNIFDILIYSEF